MSSWKRSARQEVHELARAVVVLRSLENARELDLPEAAVLDDGGRSLVRAWRREEHLRRGARRVGDDDRPIPLSGRARKAHVVRLLPAVHDEDAVFPQPPPEVLPARLSVTGDRCEQEGEPGVEVAAFSTTSMPS